MATYNAKHVVYDYKKAGYRVVAFTGTVINIDEEPLERSIEVLNYSTNRQYNTVSDSNGDFSCLVECGSKDKLRCVCLGDISNNENSLIFDYVSGA